MKNNCVELTEKKEMEHLCHFIKNNIKHRNYTECEEVLRTAFGDYPDSPIPHNLYGILNELGNKHLLAMKHFRAAYSLDPSYEPARYNMDVAGNICADASLAFDEAGMKRRFHVILMRGF